MVGPCIELCLPRPNEEVQFGIVEAGVVGDSFDAYEADALKFFDECVGGIHPLVQVQVLGLITLVLSEEVLVDDCEVSSAEDAVCDGFEVGSADSENPPGLEDAEKFPKHVIDVGFSKVFECRCREDFSDDVISERERFSQIEDDIDLGKRDDVTVQEFLRMVGIPPATDVELGVAKAAGLERSRALSALCPCTRILRPTIEEAEGANVTVMTVNETSHQV